MTDSPNVTQADRDAAAYYFSQTADPRKASAAKSGRYDLSMAVQTFARHREQTTAAIVAWLRGRNSSISDLVGHELADAIERGEHRQAQETNDD